MSEQRLSEKNTNKFRRQFPDLPILKVTTWGHCKALWCTTGLFIWDGEKIELSEDWNGFGRYIGTPSIPSNWKKEYGENYVFSPGDINE